VRAIGAQRAVIDLAAREIGPSRNIKCAVIVGGVTVAVTIGDIGLGQACIVSGEAAVGMGNRAEPFPAARLARRNSSPS
jgi:hypothetical protein